MFQRFITEMPKKWISALWIILMSLSTAAHADCKDPALRKQVAEVAKVEGVNEKELLSIIAHESRCHFNVIAWNLPRKPETAKSKFFGSLQEAKQWAEELIATKKYRVDVGIGQINNEAHIRPKGWGLDEVLNPETALNRVAQVLKERGWANYHSSNPVYAERWRKMALMALNQVFEKDKNQSIVGSPIKRFSFPKIASRSNTGELIVFDMTRSRDNSVPSSPLLVRVQRF